MASAGCRMGPDPKARFSAATCVPPTTAARPDRSGQQSGIFGSSPNELTDLNKYLNASGIKNKVPITVLSTDGSKTSCVKSAGCDDTEQTIDMTQALGMAPGLASLVMYVGRTDTAILSAMTTHHPLPTTIACSWMWWGHPAAVDPYFKRMAAQVRPSSAPPAIRARGPRGTTPGRPMMTSLSRSEARTL